VNPMDNPTYPAVAHAMEERNELMRAACERAIKRHEAGEVVDPFHLSWARQIVACIPALNRPLGTGEPS